MIDGLEPPRPVPSQRSARDDLVRLIEVEEEWVSLHGMRLVAAVLLEQDDHPELLERFRRRVVHPSRAAVVDALRAGIDRGELRQGSDKDEVIDALVGAYWGRSWAAGAPTRGWAGRLVDAILQGLLAAPLTPDTAGARAPVVSDVRRSRGRGRGTAAAPG